MDDIIIIIADMQRFPYENPLALAADDASCVVASDIYSAAWLPETLHLCGAHHQHSPSD